MLIACMHRPAQKAELRAWLLDVARTILDPDGPEVSGPDPSAGRAALQSRSGGLSVHSMERSVRSIASAPWFSMSLQNGHRRVAAESKMMLASGSDAGARFAFFKTKLIRLQVSPPPRRERVVLIAGLEETKAAICAARRPLHGTS